VLAFGFAATTSGVPRNRAAGASSRDVNPLPDMTAATAACLAEAAQRHRQPGDLLIASVHWGGNWGYEIPSAHQAFAHALVEGGFDLMRGHSSHHAKGIEIYRQKPILYGCGDFINDYEGISGYEDLRNDLAVMYVPQLDGATGRVLSLEMVPMQIRRLGYAASPWSASIRMPGWRCGITWRSMTSHQQPRRSPRTGRRHASSRRGSERLPPYGV
jgi:poly-gamma-glutamate capsule biosynthesis protein CapA/YwtB (metallophosphatase superfamily)